MDRIEACFQEVRAFCQQHADPALVQKYQHYFKEGYDAYGLEQKLMEAQRDAWLRAWKSELGADGLLSLGDRLMRTGKYEEASFALWFAEKLAKEYTPAMFERLGGWLDDGVCNWAHSDMLSGTILFQFIQRGVVSLPDFAPWVTAESRWKRRAAAVGWIKPAKKLDNVQPLLDFFAPLMSDAEKVVHQGMGWLLRELWKKQPAPVMDYLLRWKDTCPRLIIQYASEKMTVEDKARLKRAK
jgi:3-methyladenine DNA glycosylase AlkD